VLVLLLEAVDLATGLDEALA